MLLFDASEASVFTEFAASDPHLNRAVDLTLIGFTDIDLPVNAAAPCDDALCQSSVNINILSILNRRCQHRVTTSPSTEPHQQQQPVEQQFRNRVRNGLF